MVFKSFEVELHCLLMGASRLGSVFDIPAGMSFCLFSRSNVWGGAQHIVESSPWCTRVMRRHPLVVEGFSITCCGWLPWVVFPHLGPQWLAMSRHYRVIWAVCGRLNVQGWVFKLSICCHFYCFYHCKALFAALVMSEMYAFWFD